MVFTFPEDAQWNDTEQAVEFGIQLGEYEGRVFIPRSVFQVLIGTRPTAEECIRCFHLERTQFERVAEEKVRARELDADANIRISGRDLRRLKR